MYRNLIARTALRSDSTNILILCYNLFVLENEKVREKGSKKEQWEGVRESERGATMVSNN